jgi:hypothetical protein
MRLGVGMWEDTLHARVVDWGSAVIHMVYHLRQHGGVLASGASEPGRANHQRNVHAQPFQSR